MTDKIRGGYVTIKETYVTYLNSAEMEAYQDGASIVDFYESGDLVEVEVTDVEYGS